MVRSPAQADGTPPVGGTTPIIGMYAVPAEACSLVAATGITIVQTYDFESDQPVDPEAFALRARAYLREAHRHGLRVLLGIPRNWIRTGRVDAIQSAVALLRDEPGLWAWYEDEIAQGGEVEAVVRYAQAIEAADPVHGVILEEGKDLAALRNLGKARMFTYYPVSAAARSKGQLKPLRGRFPVHTLNRPWWPALQAYGRDRIAGAPDLNYVTPTRDELRYTQYSALIAGARGVFFYTYLHSTRYDSTAKAAGKWPYVEAKPLPEMAPSTWEAVKQCVAEAQVLLPELQSPVTPPAVRAASPLEVGAWRSGSSLWVCLANPRYAALACELTLPDSTVAVQELRGFTCHSLAVPAARVVQLSIPGPGAVVLRVDVGSK